MSIYPRTCSCRDDINDAGNNFLVLQMTEIRQLTNIIHHLEKKLGIESGNYIRSQLEKDSLKDKLDQISRDDISGRKSSNVVVDSSESSIKTVRNNLK